VAYLYDPRAKTFVNTNNPAIIMADAMIRIGAIEPDEKFWRKIELLANYADSGNGIGPLVKHEYEKELKKTAKRKPRKKKQEKKPEIIEMPKKRLTLKAKINGKRAKKNMV
jgi:hypothetical protein